MNTPDTKIEFLGFLVRTTDGKTVAIDLDGEDLELNFSAVMPQPEPDVRDFGLDDHMVYLAVPTRIDISVTGHRLGRATKLCTYRLIKDGEPPFPPFEANDLREAR